MGYQLRRLPLSVRLSAGLRVIAPIVTALVTACSGGAIPVAPPTSLPSSSSLSIAFENRLPSAVAVTRYWSTHLEPSWRLDGVSCAAPHRSMTHTITFDSLTVAAIPEVKLVVNVKRGTKNCSGPDAPRGRVAGSPCTLVFPPNGPLRSRVTLKRHGRAYALSTFEPVDSIVPVCL